MKIACLIGNPPMLTHFVRVLHAEFGVSLIIQEQPAIRLRARMAELGMAGTLRAAGRKLKANRMYDLLAERILGDGATSLPQGVEILNTQDINDASVKKALMDLQPDIVLVNGTSLIKSSTLEGLPLVLNIHAGLSPYYRGSYCTEWALLNQDPYNIGYTIHRISERIDGGDILSQSGVSIESDDNGVSIHMKLIRDSTNELVKIIRSLEQGQDLRFSSQAVNSSGFLYLAKHWTNQHRIALKGLLANDGIGNMLRKPSRKSLPIIRWGPQG
jgi:methionyl-tRNA formyltransferase